MRALFKSLFEPRVKLLQQERELEQLRKDYAALKSQNESMREGMRRCTTCEYRLDCKARQSEALSDH